MTTAVDVVVVGGGPAGSCAAGSLAAAGADVLVVEGRTFPREHIGESLLAMSMPYLRTWGVAERVEAAGFVRKPGAIFVWGGTDRPLELGMPHPGYAFQVERSRFDALLLDAAREQGATVAEARWVRAPVVDDGGRVVGVELSGRAGGEVVTARHVVDASGLHQLLPRKLGLPLALSGPRRAAVSGYFSGADRLPAPHADDIISEACDDGWLWFIPLGPSLTSVGFVTDDRWGDARPGDVLARQVASSSLVRGLLERASVARDARLLRYTNHVVDAPTWGDGYVLVGDSAAFVDPLFSTGVHGALHMASHAAAAIVATAEGRMDDATAAAWYDAKVREHYHRVDETVRLLYGVHPGPGPFWRSRDLSGMSDDEAEVMARRLGVVGMALFAKAAEAGTLTLPAPMARRVGEFAVDFRPVPADLGTTVTLAPEVERRRDWTWSGGRAVPSVTLAHRRRRTKDVEQPADSPEGRLLARLDAGAPVAGHLAALGQDGPGPERAALLVGTLLQAGVLAEAAAPRSADRHLVGAT